MVYLTRYEEYPIYEPAEGGYYYPGNEVVAHERLSKRQAKRKLEAIWKECLQENIREYGEENPSDHKAWHRGSNEYHNHIWKGSRYIGEGQSIIIERRLGSETTGWHPYC